MQEHHFEVLERELGRNEVLPRQPALVADRHHGQFVASIFAVAAMKERNLRFNVGRSAHIETLRDQAAFVSVAELLDNASF